MQEEFVWNFPSTINEIKTVISPTDIGWHGEPEVNSKECCTA